MEEENKSSGFSIGSFFKLTCFVFVLVPIAAIVFLILQRDRVVETLFDELNDGVERRQVSEDSNAFEIVSEIFDKLAEESEDDETEILLDEDEVSILLEDTFPELKEVQADIRFEQMEISWITIEGAKNELFGVVRISRVDDTNIINHIGTSEIGVQKIITNLIISRADELVDQADEDSSIDRLFRELIKASNSMKISDIEYLEDELIITLQKND